jgi:hypothetical protein
MSQRRDTLNLIEQASVRQVYVVSLYLPSISPLIPERRG